MSRLIFAFALIAGLSSGCDSTPIGSRCRGASECSRGEICIDGRCRAGGGDTGPSDGGGDPNEAVSLRIEPADAVLESVDGSMPTQALRAILTERDGDERMETAVSWSGGGIAGEVDAMGVYTAGGSHAGRDQVFVVYRGLRAMTTVSVNIRRTILGPGVTPDIPTRFGSAMPGAGTTNIVYPLEGAVMPANVYAPTVQWEPAGAPTDFFRVSITEPGVTITAYVSAAEAGFTHSFLPASDVWRVITDSGPASDTATTIVVDRLDTATSTLMSSTPRMIRLARGSIYGRVYYWVLDRGRTETLDPRAATTTATVPNPAPATSGTSAGSRCVACHTVSPDGRWLHGHRIDGAMLHFDLTTSLAADPAPMRFGEGPALLTSGTFDPTGTRMIGMSGWAGRMLVMDATTGMEMPATGLPAAAASFPFWSYDGASVVYAGNATLDGNGHPISGDIMRIDRMGDTLGFGAPTTLHTGSLLSGAVEGGSCDSHPVYTPDDMFVVFQHGPRTFSFVPGDPSIPPGALYITPPDGTLTRRLDAANGGPSGTSAYWPSFAPYITDEMGGSHYYWVAFYSRRDYGNTLAGSRSVRQLWIAAIDPSRAGDPSFVPYWLPGQDRVVNNISAYWAPEPCRVTGTSCGASGECCSMRCDMGPDEEPICLPPLECRGEGETCGADGDCCDARCEGNVCIGVIM